MKKSLSSLLFAMLIALFLAVPNTASAATVTKTGILPSKLELETVWPDFGANTPLLPNRVEDLNRGLIDGNTYVGPSGSSVHWIQLTFGPFAQGNVNRIPDGSCLSSLTLSATADLTGNGVILYYWNKARMSVGKIDSGVRSVESSNALKNAKIGQFLQYSTTEGDEYGWGSYRVYRPSTAASGDVTVTHDIGIADLSTKDFNDGNFAVTVSSINSTDILKNISLSYVSTDTGCKTPVTISSVADTKEFDDSTTATAGKAPVVTVGNLAAGDVLDPATCVQTFNTKTVGINKGLGVNRGCKIMNLADPIVPVDNTSNYEISWAAALGTISAVAVPAPAGNSGGGSSVTYRSVNFDVNGGNGSMAAVSNYYSNPLPAATLTKPGFRFVGWNTQSDGKGATYADAATYSFDADATLYAQWVAEQPIVKSKKQIATFVGDKAKLTSGMLPVIAKWVKKLPAGSSITCQGSTSGVKVTAFDKNLAKARAKNVCNQARAIRKDLTYVLTVNPSSSSKVTARHVWMSEN